MYSSISIETLIKGSSENFLPAQTTIYKYVQQVP